MNGRKAIAFGWWTFGYIIVAAALFTFSTMGDCLQGADGTACRARSGHFTEMLLLIEVGAYAVLTWVLFFRRR